MIGGRISPIIHSNSQSYILNNDVIFIILLSKVKIMGGNLIYNF